VPCLVVLQVEAVAPEVLIRAPPCGAEPVAEHELVVAEHAAALVDDVPMARKSTSESSMLGGQSLAAAPSRHELVEQQLLAGCEIPGVQDGTAGAGAQDPRRNRWFEPMTWRGEGSDGREGDCRSPDPVRPQAEARAPSASSHRSTTPVPRPALPCGGAGPRPRRPPLTDLTPRTSAELPEGAPPEVTPRSGDAPCGHGKPVSSHPRITRSASMA
jgi:hypothetical protein